MTFFAIAIIVFTIVAAVTIAAAYVAGGSDERRVASGCLAAIVSTQAATLLTPGWDGPKYGVFLVDVVFALYFGAVAVSSRQWWPIWAAAAQLASALCHLAPFVIPGLPKLIYLTIQPIWAFVVFGCLAWGIRGSMRRG